MSRLIISFIVVCFLIHISAGVTISLRGGIGFPGTSWFDTCSLNSANPSPDSTYPILLTFVYTPENTIPIPTTVFRATQASFKLDIKLTRDLGIADDIAAFNDSSLDENFVSTIIEGSEFLLSSWTFQQTFQSGANYYVYRASDMNWTLAKRIATGTHIKQETIASGYFFDCNLSPSFDRTCLTMCDVNCFPFPEPIPDICH